MKNYFNNRKLATKNTFGNAFETCFVYNEFWELCELGVRSAKNIFAVLKEKRSDREIFFINEKNVWEKLISESQKEIESSKKIALAYYL